QKKALDKLETKLKDYIAQQTVALGDILASQASRYMLASRKLAPADGLDPETLERWTKYLATPRRAHQYLKPWQELAARNASPEGVLYYGDGRIDRFLSGEWKRRLEALRAEVAEAKKALPAQYPFLQIVKDRANPSDIRIAIRGDNNNRGDVAPRRFVSILCEGEPKPFTNGSGRLELAEAIADPKNPLTA